MMDDPPATAPPADLGDPALVAAIRAEIVAAGGRITFARFMELALYHPGHGYYLVPARRPGRGGDFLTAPETHPFFGITLARQVAECWERLGRPEPFIVREYGAGVGGLAYDVIAGLSAAAPDILAALRYRLIEPNPHRVAQALAALTETGLAAIVTAETITADTPLPPITGVILANEVADALPVHRLIVRDGHLRECYVEWKSGRFTEIEDELYPDVRTADPAATLQAAGVTLNEGDAIEVSPAAATWVADVAAGLARGYVFIIDYGYDTADLYRAHRLGGTLRAHRGHTVSDDPFIHVGRQDLTAHVDFGALRRAGEDAGLTFVGLTTQAAFLTGLGLGELLVQFQQDPETSVADYLAARAAVFRLIDPGGMGRFGVLAMARDVPLNPPLRGFTVAPPGF